MKTKFHHKRIITNTGEVSGKGGITIAYEEQDNGYTKYAVAKCHEHDNFKKEQGRVKSAGRLQSAKHMIMFKGTPNELIQYIERMPNNMIGV